MVLNNEIKEIVFRLCAKNGHGTPSVTDYNHYANLANTDLFNFYAQPLKTIGANGKPAPLKSVGLDTQINQALRPFIKTATVAVTAGQAIVPTDLEVMDTMRTGSVAIDWVPQHKISGYLTSTIDVPSADYPIYTDTATTFSIYPTTISSVEVIYLKTPVVVDWKYTLTNGRPVYNATGTVNFEWAPAQKLSLITRILGYIGVEIRDGELLNYVNNEQQKAS